jgi:hypothetical protein
MAEDPYPWRQKRMLQGMIEGQVFRALQRAQHSSRGQRPRKQTNHPPSPTLKGSNENDVVALRGASTRGLYDPFRVDRFPG